MVGEIVPIKVGREKLASLITDAARDELKSLGIELIDVLIRRIAYEKSVETKVFDRMISERKRIAEKIRSVGKGEEAKIRGQLALDLKKIESEAYRKSQIVKGEGEAKSIKIYADALKQDAEFFSFVRTLEAYKATFPKRANLVLATDSEFFKLLERKQ